MRKPILITAMLAVGILPVRADVFVTEVYSAGSGNRTYAADWFELTNFGTSAISIAGWKMDDLSQSPAGSVALRGVTSIGAGQSVVFIEGDATGTTDAALAAAFNIAWFGTPNSPILIGGYGGLGVELSATVDQVNIFNPASLTPSEPVTSVYFGGATVGRTFDNAAGINSYVAPFTSITTLSSVGVNGAFLSANGQEIGSPGAVPEPSTGIILISGIATLLGFRAHRRKRQVATN